MCQVGTVGVGTAQPGKDKAQGGILSECINTWWEGVMQTGQNSSQSCPVKE